MAVPGWSDEQTGRGVAAFVLERFQLATTDFETTHSVNEHGLSSFTNIKFLGERSAARVYQATVRLKPESAAGIAAVKRDTGGEPELREAVAFQKVVTVELRYFPSENLFLVFGAKEVARQVFHDLQKTGACKGKPLKLDLHAMNQDPEKQDIFNAWAEGTGRITSKAYFGHEVLDHDELRRATLRSIRAEFLIDKELVHLFIAADGRVTFLGRDADNDDLEKLFRRLLRYRIIESQTSRLSV